MNKPVTREATREKARAPVRTEVEYAGGEEVREAVRDAVREEPLPPGAVRGRNGEVLLRKRTGVTDPFFIPPELKEPGWSYEWKTETIYNQEATAHQVMLAENGWRPVMSTGRWSGVFMPNSHEGKPIRRDAMVLMERPDSLTREAYDEERKKARRQMADTRESLRLATPSGFTTQHAGVQPRVSQSYEAGPAPSKHNLTSD